MPDQVRLHDPQPQCEERHLGLYGPHSPGSDSPLSLVVRKEEHRKLQVYPVESPGRSSGFSDGSGSYESSPNRSPSHPQDSGHQPAYDAQDNDKPLSLVIRKNLVSHFQSSVGPTEYSVHSKALGVTPKKKWRAEEEEQRRGQDSGNEEEEEHVLVISEQVEEEEEEDRVYTEDTVFDFSKKTETESKPTTGIKIKDFARLEMPTPEPGSKEPAEAEEEELESELESDCASISSVDTWSSSLAEGKPFSGTDAVIRRVRSTSSGDTVYQCDFCDKLFANKYHLQSHLVTHTGERAFTCRTCKKTFGRKSTLRAHMTTHTKVSNFMCTVCEKACNDNNSLEEHMRMHTGEKPFVCTICQKAYARKSHLNVHYRVHTGERPFVCDYCNKDFTEKRFLNDHMQTAHNGVDGPLKCPNCAREFAYKTSLKQHLKKQMCERNMKRAHGNLGAGSVAKQFQCPFCDKSYSWKQTLKQHVSMYHRNKVHTDEFWRYELTKNRRTVMDDMANEDLWKQQLGKHAEEAAKLKKEAAEAAAAAAAATEESSSRGMTPAPQEQEQQPLWQEQLGVEATEASTAASLEPASTEMKLLALQNLQSSLHFISMGMSGPQLAAMTSLQRLAGLHSSLAEPPVKLEPSAPPQDSYLSLLAKLAQKESEDRQAETGESSSITPGPPAILPAKEESSIKRTQLWLQQVNKYRHKPPKEELDANHEQLWEQQISRVKKNPVRSPLEPVEILIEDDGEKSSSGSPRHTLQTSHSRRSTITNNNPESVVVYQARAATPQPQPVLVFPASPRPVTPRVVDTPPPSQPSPAPTPAPEEGGLLKSLLLDRMKRKRSSSKDIELHFKKSPSPHMTPSPHMPTSKPLAITETPSDILRKRLLGLVDPPSVAMETPPRFTETPERSQDTPPRRSLEAPRHPSDTPQIMMPQAAVKQESGVHMFQLDLEDREKDTEAPVKKEEATYAKTSVLKHLLHRYTGTNQ